MKKRCSAFFLALVLCVGLAVPAFAETGSSAVISGASEYFLGKYTLEQQDIKSSSDSFVAQEIIFDYDSNPPEHSGYYAITEDAVWTVSNTASDDFGVMISFSERCKESDHYSTRNICWIMPDGTFSLAYKGIDQEKLILKSGQSVTFNLKDAVSAMKVTADPNSLYEMEIMDSNYPGDGDSYLFKLGSNTNSDVTDEKPTSSPSFTDVKAGAFYEDAVKWAVAHQPAITNGTSDTTFSPDEECTHVQILTFLWRAAGEPEPMTQRPLYPVQLNGSEYYAQAVRWAEDHDMVDSHFNPDAKCTRAQAMAYIWAAFDRPEVAKSSFTDVPADADYSAAVDWAVSSGITKGTSDTTFSPDQVCNRGQIVTFLYRAYAG